MGASRVLHPSQAAWEVLMASPYQPKPLPVFEGAESVQKELSDIGDVISNIQEGEAFEKRYTAPLRPKEGQIAFADGNRWDPGGGKGYYWYDADTKTWNKMG